MTAHPHVRGEDRRRPGPWPARTGSPPRAWGGRADHGGHGACIRLTPTCVGRTVSLPHVRPRLRLTPTCVGRTSRGPGRRRGPAAHPHVRGEDVKMRFAKISQSGSPPRAWGGLQPVLPDPAPGRLTPTCVGRTWSWPPGMHGESAHPHVRGEDGAGWSGDGGDAAHPHVRGEDTPQPHCDNAVRGSPPRAWGGRSGTRPNRDSLRLTPTCVGRTPDVAHAWLGAEAHPHVRGEDVPRWLKSPWGCGSPPRAWGGHHPQPERRR